MVKTTIRIALATSLAAVICSTAAVGQDRDTGQGADAIERAAEANKYLFIFFYRTEDEGTTAVRKSFDAALQGVSDQAMSVAVNITDPLEKAIVTRFGVARAPMPLILALASNGAITKSFVQKFDEKQLDKAFISSGQEKCLKALQERKLVLLCVQNGDTQHNAEALQGVEAFAADPRYAQATEVVKLDPSDEAEVEFLRRLKVDPKSAEAVTVLLAPPGRPIGTFKGAITKNTLVAAAQKSASGCGPKGCGPKGCGPPKKKP